MPEKYRKIFLRLYAKGVYVKLMMLCRELFFPARNAKDFYILPLKLVTVAPSWNGTESIPAEVKEGSGKEKVWKKHDHFSVSSLLLHVGSTNLRVSRVKNGGYGGKPTRVGEHR